MIVSDGPEEMPAISSRERYARIVEQALPYAVGLFIFTTPFAKVIASITHSLCIILFVMHLSFKNGHQWVSGARSYYRIIMVYCLMLVISIIYTPNPANGVHEVWRQVTRLATPVLLIELVSTEARAWKYLYAFVTGATILAVIGIAEGVFLHVSRPPSMWHPVHGANILLTGFVGSMVIAGSRPGGLLISLASATLLLSAIYQTQTRGVWVALVVVLLLSPFMLHRLSLRYKALLMGMIFLSVVLLAQTPLIRERAAQTLSDVTIYQQEGRSNPSTSFAERFDMWKASYIMFREHPLLGVGAGGWREALQEVIRLGQVPATLIAYGNPHNMFLDALSTRGILGLMALCALLAYPVYRAATVRTVQEKRPYAMLVLFITIAFAVAGLTDTLVIIRGVFPSYLIMMGIALAVLARAKTSAGTS